MHGIFDQDLRHSNQKSPALKNNILIKKDYEQQYLEHDSCPQYNNQEC